MRPNNGKRVIFMCILLSSLYVACKIYESVNNKSKPYEIIKIDKSPKAEE